MPVAAESVLLFLLLAQGVMGGIDTLLNHELIERLAYRSQARREVGLHAIREAIYATLFGGMAWFSWHGAAAAAIAALLLAEVMVTVADEHIENRTRVLPQNERVLHVFLTVNLGLIIATLVPVLAQWSSRATGLVQVDHGWLSWVLSALSAAAAAWALRDLLAWRRLQAARSF
jgi:hypothetical protein